MPFDTNTDLNFDWLIEKQAEGYRVRLLYVTSGEGMQDFTLSFNKNELCPFLTLPNPICRHFRLSQSPENVVAPLEL